MAFFHGLLTSRRLSSRGRASTTSWREQIGGVVLIGSIIRAAERTLFIEIERHEVRVGRSMRFRSNRE
jgi:hypothetical protein